MCILDTLVYNNNPLFMGYPVARGFYRPSFLVGTVSINEKKHNDAAALNIPQMLPHSKVS